MRRIMHRLYVVESEAEFLTASSAVYQFKPRGFGERMPKAFPAVVMFGELDAESHALIVSARLVDFLASLHGCVVDPLSSRVCHRGTRSCEEPSHYPPPRVGAEEAALKSGAVSKNSDGSFEFGVPGDATA